MRGSCPGDRVPDLACTRPDGTATRLHAELGGRWALLTDDERAVRVVEARLGAGAVTTLRAVAGQQAMLVRPDAHLACRGDAERLDRWLSRSLGAVPASVAT
jgi:4,5-epoxidase